MLFSLGGLTFGSCDNAIKDHFQFALSRRTPLVMPNTVAPLPSFLYDPFVVNVFHEDIQFLSQAAEVSRRNTQIPIHPQMIGIVSGGVRSQLSTPFMNVNPPLHTTSFNLNHPKLEAVHPTFEYQPFKNEEKKSIDPEKAETTRHNIYFKKNEHGIIRSTELENKINKKHMVKSIKAVEECELIKDRELPTFAGKRKRASDNVFEILYNKKHKNATVAKTVRRPVFVIKKAVHRFSAKEDEKLKELVERLGESSWSKIAKEMPGLNRKQIRDRYVNYLKKERTIKEFTAEEDQTILRLVREKGRLWSKIAGELVGRTPIMVKNRFYATLISTLDTNIDNVLTPNTHRISKKRNLSLKFLTERKNWRE